jgi:HlyD family secretion protein
MQAKTKWMAAGGVAVLAALLAWAFAPRPTLVELGEAKTGHFESGIEEDGKTRVIARYQVSAPLAGRWLRPTLEEGDAVKAGDVIGRIEPTLSPLLDARSQAQLGAREQAAQAAQARASARQAAAEIGVAQAQKNLERAEALAKQGFVAASNRDDARLALQAAQQELRSAQAEVQIARHELQQARAALGAFGAAGQGTARPFDLRAPVAGQVLRVQQPSEAMVGLGTPLLELGDVGQLEVVAELLSTDALMLKPGQPVRIERWGGPGVLLGQVERVEPGAFTKVSALGVEEQRVKVQIALASPPEQRRGLGDGYRVAVRVLTRQQDGALLVPVSAVFPMPGAVPGRHAVFRADGGHARLTEVRVEARNSSDAWISKGLDAGAKVVSYPPQGLVDGARIKAR